MEIESFDDGESTYTIVHELGGYNAALTQCLLSCCCCLLPLGPRACKSLARRIEERRNRPAIVKKYGKLRTFREYLDEFKSALGTGPFLGGSSTPGAVDISFYGTLYMWNSVPFVQRSLKASGLDEWASKMESFRSSKKKRRGK